MVRRLLVLPLMSIALGIALSASRLEVQGLPAFDGRPAFSDGSELSYFVWRDGNSWHLRWTTLGAPRIFTGTVRATGGTLESLDRVDVETELKVIRPGRPARVVRGPRGRVRGVAPGRAPIVASTTEDHITKVDDHLIRWNTEAAGDIDGFNFKVDGVDALTFDLNIAGMSKPRSVEIGRNNVHPESNPFTVRLR